MVNIKNFFAHYQKKNIPFLMLIPLYLFVASFCSVAVWYAYKNHSIIPTAEKNLQKIVRITEKDINAYLKTEEKNACTLAESIETKELLYATLSHKKISQKMLETYHTYATKQQKSMDCNNILLIDTDKTIQFSVSNKNLIGQQVTEKNTFLYLSYERAMMSLTPDFSEYGHDALFTHPTLFICVPVVHKKRFTGILAYECNLSSIAALTNHYTGLGSTGEIVLAQKNDAFILYIAPTRHDRDLAFKRKKISSKNPPAIQNSILGKQGMGKAVDYRNISVVGAWTFIPKTNWGVMVKMDQKEIEHPLSFLKHLLLIVCLCIIAWILLLEYAYNHPLRTKISSLASTPGIKHIPDYVKNYVFVLLILSCGLLIKTCSTYYLKQQHFSSEETYNIMNDIKEGTTEINTILKKIAFTTSSIADDLGMHRLSGDDITKRLKRDIKENKNITSITIAFAPYAYDATIQLYAPTLSKEEKTYTETMLQDTYDYTNPNLQDPTTQWYKKAIEQKEGVWNSHPTSYSYPFFDNNKQLLAVVHVTFSLNTIERITAYSSLDRKGYSILLSEDQTFLVHPIKDFVSQEKTLLAYAQDNQSQTLASIAEKLSHTSSHLAAYTLHNTPMWIYTETIETNNWTLCALFSKEDISLPIDTVRHYYFWILFYTITTLLLASAYAYYLQKTSLLIFISIINIILSLGLIASWRVIQTATTTKTTNSTIISDEASLDNFLENIQEESTRKNEEPPIKIPCGLMLYSVGMSQPKEMVVSGYIWNKYHLTTHENITHAMQIPHAIKLMKDKPTTSTANNWKTVTWNIRGTIFEKQNYAHYPFDKQQMQITFEHHDIEKNIILTPDLEDYKKIGNNETLGLDKNFTVAGFNVEKAFFSYKKIEPAANFGFSNYGKVTDHYLLVYNLIIKRNVLNPFVLFFLPFLVILFLLFSILLIAKRDSVPLSIISAYTGLCFTLVVLQRSLREQYPTNTTLYMEYAFFFAYIYIIFLVIHTVVTYLYPEWNYYQNKIFPLVKLLFWPLHLAAWLITTLIIFY